MSQLTKTAPLVVSRNFSATCEVVFQAWSSAKHLQNWFSPDGYTVSHAEADFRAGGAFVICMRSPGGKESWLRGHFTEISPPDSLSFSGDVTIDGERKFSVRTAVTFIAEEFGTRMDVKQTYEIHDAQFSSAVEGAREGWRTTLDKLEGEILRLQASYSATHGSFTLERIYPASLTRVFQALTDKTAKEKWFDGGKGWKLIERKMDVRPGGRECVQGQWANGMVTSFDAVYFDVIPNRRLVYAYEMHVNRRRISVSLATLEFTGVDAGTKLVITEQGTFLNGYEDCGSRKHGTGILLDRLGVSFLS